MTYTYDGYNYLIRLETGERLMESLEQFARETKLTMPGAWLSGLGGASEATIGFYDLQSKEYAWQTFTELMEVASLTGNIAYDEQGMLVCHLHGVLAGKDLRAVAGHVKDLVAGATLELFAHRAYQPMRRFHDDATGLALLKLN